MNFINVTNYVNRYSALVIFYSRLRGFTTKHLVISADIYVCKNIRKDNPYSPFLYIFESALVEHVLKKIKDKRGLYPANGYDSPFL